VTAYAGGEHVLSGLTGLVLLKSTGSEFRGFLVDELTTLPPTADRVLATALTARWRWGAVPSDGYDTAYDEVRALLVSRFGSLHSLALQQTLWEMGRSVLSGRADIAELRMSAPNKHHNLVDLTPFGLENPGEVFVAADRPYGLIEVTVERDGEDAAPDAWRDLPGFV
jgi:urate oxidase